MPGTTKNFKSCNSSSIEIQNWVTGKMNGEILTRKALVILAASEPCDEKAAFISTDGRVALENISQPGKQERLFW